MTEIIIKHQKQPCSRSCGATCIAMVLGMPVEQVIEEFHEDYHKRKTSIKKYLKSKGVDSKDVYCNNQVAQEGKLQLVMAPIIGNPSVQHCIVVDKRNGTTKIYDPQQGYPGCTYYSTELDNALATPLGQHKVAVEL